MLPPVSAVEAPQEHVVVGVVLGVPDEHVPEQT